MRDILRRLDELDRRSTARAGGWVLAEQDGQPVFTKPGEATLLAGQPVAASPVFTPTASLYTTPPNEWSTENLAEDTVLQTGGGVVLIASSVAGTNLRIAHRPLALASLYRVTAHIEALWYPTGTVRAGLMLRDSDSGKAIVFGPAHDSGAKLAVAKYSNATTYSADYVGLLIAALPYGVPQWLRISDDGTDRICEFSYNGADWMQVHAVARDDFVEPDQVGLVVLNASSGQPVVARMRSFTQQHFSPAQGAGEGEGEGE
ncbi:hypothetical protein MPUL_00310 [Mycolicibacterium pulveris]|uniref:DUF1349 domain-containing protein n=1 Tax=Mycolicibacterium pulveris TaxID=36813 RepID=A0A7I7UD73_MYCPV|nr:hypothetical protein [Mycolicibacterium pulveris]BBY78873.1 hypothetical protein MPUL_00310 [Mycolicibacterium pulveris]